MQTTKSVISVNVAALFVEGLLYGVFALFFCIILSIALGPKHSSFMNRTRILQISSLMFILASLHLILSSIRIFVAFNLDGLDDHITTSLEDLQDMMVIAKTFIGLLQIMLGDSILVWRCFVLHNKMVWVLIPGIVILMFDTGILVMYRALITRGLVFLGGWPVVFPALSVVLHTSYTAIIVWRIYHTNKSQSDHTSGRSLIPVMAAVIESGAIYSATAIILLSCISANSVGLPVVMDAVPPLVGIIFCLGILQIHVYYVKDREPAPGGVSANWSIPWRREQRNVDEVSDAAP